LVDPSEDVDMVKTVWFQLRQEQRKTLGNYDWIFVVKEIAGVIQVMPRPLFNVVIHFLCPFFNLMLCKNIYRLSFFFVVENLLKDFLFKYFLQNGIITGTSTLM
jgi:hypothetical protein